VPGNTLLKITLTLTYNVADTIAWDLVEILAPSASTIASTVQSIIDSTNDASQVPAQTPASAPTLGDSLQNHTDQLTTELSALASFSAALRAQGTIPCNPVRRGVVPRNLCSLIPLADTADAYIAQLFTFTGYLNNTCVNPLPVNEIIIHTIKL
jgi:hypothetical protein